MFRRGLIIFFSTLLVEICLHAQDAPPSIVVEGVPAVPAEFRVRMNQYEHACGG